VRIDSLITGCNKLNSQRNALQDDRSIEQALVSAALKNKSFKNKQYECKQVTLTSNGVWRNNTNARRAFLNSGLTARAMKNNEKSTGPKHNIG